MREPDDKWPLNLKRLAQSAKDLVDCKITRGRFVNSVVAELRATDIELRFHRSEGSFIPFPIPANFARCTPELLSNKSPLLCCARAVP